MSNQVEVIIAPDSNFDQIVLMIENGDARMAQEIKDALFESTLYVVDQIKSSPLMPRKTGTLSRSITYAINPDGSEIGSDLPYAYIQEYGGTYTFHRSSAWGRQTRPFSYDATYKEKAYLRTPFAEAQGRIEEIFDQHMTNAFAM